MSGHPSISLLNHLSMFFVLYISQRYYSSTTCTPHCHEHLHFPKQHQQQHQKASSPTPSPRQRCCHRKERPGSGSEASEKVVASGAEVHPVPKDRRTPRFRQPRTVLGPVRSCFLQYQGAGPNAEETKKNALHTEERRRSGKYKPINAFILFLRQICQRDDLLIYIDSGV